MRLAPVFLGSLARRRAATLFSFAAIVLGVALGMAVQELPRLEAEVQESLMARPGGSVSLAGRMPRTISSATLSLR